MEPNRILYDANGNMTNDGSRNFVYDANNTLVEVKNASSGATIASFEYDANGRRTSMTTASGTTKFYYDGKTTNVLYETDGSGTLLARYIYGQSGQMVAMVRGASTYFYHYNGHGDVVALTDSIGTVVAEYDYDAFGNPVTTGLEGTVVNPYRYAGYRYDAETGLYYLNARYYAPCVGRFITRDSFHGFEDDPLSLNQYNYAHSNPIRYYDPSGYNALLVGLAGTYVIPVIGEVTITATVVIVAGIGVIKAGSWLYNKIRDYVIRAQNNKTIKKKIDSLNRQIETHKEKIRKEPNSQARRHWEKEIRNWEKEIAKLRKKLGK